MLWRPPTRTRLSRGNPWSRGLYRVGAWIYTVMAVVTGIAAWRIPVTPALDFDLSGFLFMLTNLPLVFAWGLTIMFAFGAVYCWTRMFFSPASPDESFF